MNRRLFLRSALLSAAALPVTARAGRAPYTPPRFRLSLAQWSLRERLRSGALRTLDFPAVARREFSIDAIEYVNTFFEGRERSPRYLHDLGTRASDAGVTNVLVMVDLPGRDGHLAHADPAVRRYAADAHRRWIDVAHILGCRAIRVNAQGYEPAAFEQAQTQFVHGLRLLAAHGRQAGVRILVENHGGHSSHGEWLAGVMREVADDACGTLPDFGNFTIDRETGLSYYPVRGLRDLMPFAGGVSAKAHDFGPDGLETTIDYPAMLSVVIASPFSGYIGIEWGGAGRALTPEAGILATRRLLTRLLGTDLAAGA